MSSLAARVLSYAIKKRRIRQYEEEAQACLDSSHATAFMLQMAMEALAAKRELEAQCEQH